MEQLLRDSETLLNNVRKMQREMPGTWRWWLKITGYSMAGAATGAMIMLGIVRFLH